MNERLDGLTAIRDEQGAVLYGPMAQALYQGEPVDGEGTLETIEYACGDRLIQSDKRPTPGTCPECGGRLHG